MRLRRHPCADGRPSADKYRDLAVVWHRWHHRCETPHACSDQVAERLQGTVCDCRSLTDSGCHDSTVVMMTLDSGQVLFVQGSDDFLAAPSWTKQQEHALQGSVSAGSDCVSSMKCGQKIKLCPLDEMFMVLVCRITDWMCLYVIHWHCLHYTFLSYLMLYYTDFQNWQYCPC